MTYNVYYGANVFRRTGMDRATAIEHYRKIEADPDRGNKSIHIYCPTGDFYVDDYFLPHWLDLDSCFGKLMFDDGAQLLSKEAEGIHKWRRGDEIVITDQNTNEIIITPQC